MLKLALFVLPLGLDTFAVATARGLPARDRTRVSLLMSSFLVDRGADGAATSYSLDVTEGRAPLG